MPFVLLSLAAVALAAGLIVLWLDQRQRAALSAGDPADNAATDTADDAAVDAKPVASTPEPELTAEPEPVAEHNVEPFDEPGAEPNEPEEPEEPEELTAESNELTEPQAAARSFAERAERAKYFVPGSARRERKAFGQQRGWEYAKHDSYLADEWSRGAAARGQEPRDIVAGNFRNHETLLFDMGTIPVMAMRTGAASDIVVDFRRAGEKRAGETVDNSSEDLVYVREEEGFEVFASDAGVGQRLIDPRVSAALHRLPTAVTAVWMEGEWVLAQTTKHARSAEWEELLEPLALLADAARVLPPRSEATQVLRVDELDPSRDIPQPPQPEPTGPTAVPDRDDSLDAPTIQRPTEPVVMPSRSTSEARGTIDHSSLGADEVDAIADGREHPTPEDNQARLPRRFDGGSSIFD